jgi:transaldolase
VARARSLLALYREAGVGQDKLIFRVPATWAGIQAGAELEKEGVAMQAFHIYRWVWLCVGGGGTGGGVWRW